MNDEDKQDAGREVAWFMTAIIIVAAIMMSWKTMSYLLSVTDVSPKGDMAAFGGSAFILGCYLGMWLQRRRDKAVQGESKETTSQE